MKMAGKDYLYGALAIVCLVAGTSFGIYMEMPQTIYERKVEGDNRQFLVTESKGGVRWSFVRTSPQESFKRLDSLQEQERINLEQENNSLKQKLLK